MELGFRELNARIEELDRRLKKRADSISYPDWFMMPTNEGVRFLLATVLLGLASFNTGNNLIYLIFGLMLSIILISYVLVTINIRGLMLKVKSTGPVYALEESEIIVKMRNNKRLASYSIRIHLPGEFASNGYLPFIDGEGTASIRIKVRPAIRGVFGYGSFIIESSFPFIFFRRRCRVHVDGGLTVYPALMDVSLEALEGRRGKGVLAQRAGEGDELLSLREFREGDSQRSVHWKASAKSGGLLVKEYSALLPRMAMIVIDSTGSSDPEHFEKAVSYAASAVLWLIDMGYYVGLDAPGFHLPYGSGKGHMYRLLEQLAVITEDPKSNSFPDDVYAGAVILVKKSGVQRGSSLAFEPDMVVHADTL